MKKLNIVLIALVVCSIAIVAFTNAKLGGITGKINPIEGVSAVTLVSGADTLNAELNKGVFSFVNLKQGVYTIWIKANTPYKDASIENVAVKDSSVTDLGEIKLLQ